MAPWEDTPPFLSVDKGALVPVQPLITKSSSIGICRGPLPARHHRTRYRHISSGFGMRRLSASVRATPVLIIPPSWLWAGRAAVAVSKGGLSVRPSYQIGASRNQVSISPFPLISIMPRGSSTYLSRSLEKAPLAT